MAPQNVEHDTEVELLSDCIKVKLNNEKKPLKLNFMWLRDNCRCNECFSHALNQKHINILDIPNDIAPKTYEIKGNKLSVLWNNGHNSCYTLEWLSENLKTEVLPKPILWTGRASDAVTISKDDLKTQSKCFDFVKSLFVHGIAFVENVEPTEKATEEVVNTLFPVQRTFFGDMWTVVSNKLDHYDSAYTNEYIGAHNDNTYFQDAPGLQIFHLLEHNGTGGETLLVDGFRAVRDVENTNSEYVNCLKNISIESMYIEPDRHVTNFSPILHFHPNGPIKQIRFNLLDRSPRIPVPSDNIGLFYESLRCLTSKITEPGGEWWMKLKPGTVAFINNWRVLHGRKSFTGLRKLTGCYVAMSELLSRARILKVIL